MKVPHFLYLETYGCSANQNNSEIMRGLLVQSGLDMVSNPELADIIIINTCIVKGPTENTAKQRIRELEKLNKPIIIAGCMPEVRKIKGKNLYLLGISHIKDVCKLIKRIHEGKYQEKEFLERRKEIKLTTKVRQNKLVGITQISEGCLGNCSFCLTKLVKGELFSYPEDKILENIKKDIEQGCKEIWLTSQDNAAYGRDYNTNLISLLKKITELKGNFKVRIGMMNPNHVLLILPELLEIYKSDKIYKFFHIPVQSGSNKILKEMNRKYTREQFISIVKKFQKLFPEITISTDIIAGYPSESEEDFQETLSLMKEIKNDVMNISRFWPMSGTRAFSLKQLPDRTVKKRAHEVQKIHLSLALENKKKFIGKELAVFVNQQEGTNCLARDENYRLVVIRSKEELLGKKLRVRIKKAFSHYLLGEII